MKRERKINMQDVKNNFIENRLSNFRQKLREKNIDAALITKRENYLYLSGFTGSSAHLLISQSDAILITDFRYTEQASRQAALYEIVEFQGNLMEVLNDILKSKKVSKLGFEEDYITFKRYEEYRVKFEATDFIPLKGLIEGLRIIKDRDEIELIKRSVKIADDAFKHILGYIKPGVSESEIAAKLEYFMKRQGASGASFETIVASGERSSMPHGVASSKKIELGDAITLDYGALCNNYCSDMTRTVFLGEPKEELKKIYNVVLEAQLKSTEGAKAGLEGKDVDAIARNIISDKGYGKNFGHGLGHGVGLEIHEEPRLSLTANTKLENYMVVTVEPGIYITGIGGVRIEDMIIINGDKPIVITESTKEMIIL